MRKCPKCGNDGQEKFTAIVLDMYPANGRDYWIEAAISCKVCEHDWQADEFYEASLLPDENDDYDY